MPDTKIFERYKSLGGYSPIHMPTVSICMFCPWGVINNTGAKTQIRRLFDTPSHSAWSESSGVISISLSPWLVAAGRDPYPATVSNHQKNHGKEIRRKVCYQKGMNIYRTQVLICAPATTMPQLLQRCLLDKLTGMTFTVRRIGDVWKWFTAIWLDQCVVIDSLTHQTQLFSIANVAFLMSFVYVTLL